MQFKFKITDNGRTMLIFYCVDDATYEDMLAKIEEDGRPDLREIRRQDREKMKIVNALAMPGRPDRIEIPTPRVKDNQP